MSTNSNQAITDQMIISRAAELARERQWQSAGQILNPLIQREDAPVAALDLQARICVQQGRFLDAESAWQKALARDPGNDECQAGLARMRRSLSRAPGQETAVRLIPVVVGALLLWIVLAWQRHQQDTAATSLSEEIHAALAAQAAATRQLREDLKSLADQNTKIQQATLATDLGAWQQDQKALLEQQHTATVSKLADIGTNVQGLLQQQKTASGHLDQLSDLAASSITGLAKLQNSLQTNVSGVQTALSSLAGQAKTSAAATDKRVADSETQITQTVSQATAETKEGIIKAIEQQKAGSVRQEQLNDLAASLASLTKLQTTTQAQVADTQAALHTLATQVNASTAAAEKRITDLQTQIAQTIAQANAQTKDSLLKAIEEQKSGSIPPTARP